MKATDHAHIVPPDEVMAYLDGELDPRRASAVGAHIGACETCQAVADDMRRVSHSLMHWDIGNAPRALTAPADRVVVRSFTIGHLLRPFIAGHQRVAAAAAVFVVFGGLWLMNGLRFARSEAVPAVAAPQVSVGLGGTSAGRPYGGGSKDLQGFPDSKVNRLMAQERPQGQDTGPRISRTVQLSIVATEFDSVKPTIERILRDVSGLVGHIQASDQKVSVRSVQATLRIPAARLDEALAAFRQLGHVADEIQSGEDLADQITDVAARLANARNTEKRLNDILANRTGNVQSVLEVEREIARVRAEVESMDAQRVKLDDRVAYATVTLRVVEERRATLGSGSFPLSGRLRNAFIDGLREASDSVIEAALWTLRGGPVLLIWGVVIWFGARLALKRRRTAKL